MEESKCDECGGKMEKKLVEFSLYGVNLGPFPAEVCHQCAEQIFDESVSEKIEMLAKEKGLWGLGATAKVTRIGTSIGITINRQIASFMNLKQGETVFVHPEGKHKLVVETSQ